MSQKRLQPAYVAREGSPLAADPRLYEPIGAEPESRTLVEQQVWPVGPPGSASSRTSAHPWTTRPCASPSHIWSYQDVSRRADAILGRLKAGTMPCDGAWAPEKIEAFERWIAAGAPS